MNRSLVSLRSATLEDAPHLAEVWTDVHPSGRARGPGGRHGGRDRRGRWRPTDQRIVVAEYDGKFAGAVHLEHTTMSAINREPVVRALSPHVLAPYRRHGVGTALMEAAVTWAEELGIAHVATAAVAGSRDANRFMARIALGPYAVLRVATTHAVRSRLSAHRRPASAGNGRQLTQVLAARRSLRRSRAGVDGARAGLGVREALPRQQRAGDARGADPLAALVGDDDLVGRRRAAEVDGGRRRR